MMGSDTMVSHVLRLQGNIFANRFVHRVVYKSACAIVLPLCSLWAAVHLAATPNAAPSHPRTERFQLVNDLRQYCAGPGPLA